MSHEATNWAIKQRGLKPAAKIVLWHLADCHNPSHGCFPSHEYLAENAEMSISTVQRHLKDLEEIGLISRARVKQKGRFDRTEYTLHLHRSNAPQVKVTTGQNEQSPPVKMNAHHRSKLRTNLVIEPVIEPVRSDPVSREDLTPFSATTHHRNSKPSKQSRTKGQDAYDEALERSLRAAARGPKQQSKEWF